MKITPTFTIAILGIALAFGLNACSDHDHAHDEQGEHHDDHGDHDEKDHHDGEDKDHDGGEHTGHDDDKGHAGDDAEHGHDHEKLIPGPNGGRLITEVEPHLEFLVTEDRKVRISAVGEDNKSTVPIAAQTVSAVAGDRSNPTRLAFNADGGALLSDVALPDGNDFPLVLQIKAGPGADTVREKFNVNLVDCPTCDFKEYACICDHEDGDHDHEGEDHKGEKK